MFTLANLNSDQLKALQEFESEEDLKVLAMVEVQAKVAELPSDKLNDLKQLEDKLGICLVAVR